MGSCSNKSYVYTESRQPVDAETVVKKLPLPVTGGVRVNVTPNATAFRMNGDYSKNVGVTLSPSGELIYFPAPTDITAYSEPISLGDGWWLNCQGIGPNSVFTKFTFAEYAALPEVPSPQQIKKDLLPGAKVTQFIELPMKLNDAVDHLDVVKEYLKNK